LDVDHCPFRVFRAFVASMSVLPPRLAIARRQARIRAEAGRTVAPNQRRSPNAEVRNPDSGVRSLHFGVAAGEESPSTQGEALVKSEAAGRRRPVDGECHRNYTAAPSGAARVKKCGKGALSRMATSGMEKPCPVQDQYENRTGPVHSSSRVGRLRHAGNRMPR
jgi:hypothetical protein